jgi:uncharacterized membrane protein HdeD (DUF308 family)
MLADTLSRYWWIVLLRGAIWIAFGIAIFTQPGISLITLTLLFGAFAFADGIVNIANAIAGRTDNENWWLLLLSGLAGIVVGLLTFWAPGITGLALLFYIAVWAIATGLLEIVAAIRLRKEITGEFWLALAGLLSVGFGVLMVARPGVGALAVLTIIASYSIVFGIVLILLAFRVKKFLQPYVTMDRPS